MATTGANSTRIAQQTLDNVGRGVLTIAAPHGSDQDPPFVVHANTDANIDVKAMDGTTTAGVVIKAGTQWPCRLLQVTAINSGTITGIY